jgi:hypothetical protein
VAEQQEIENERDMQADFFYSFSLSFFSLVFSGGGAAGD